MSAKGRSESTVRSLRVSETVRHALASILARAEFDDETLSGVPITVSGVDVAPDLRNARVYVMPLTGKDSVEVAKALNRHAGFIRGELGRQVTLKYLPRLAFRVDESFDAASRIEQILHDPRVARDLREDRDRREDEPK